MTSLAVSVEGLGKRYAVGGPSAPYGLLRESVAGLWLTAKRTAGRSSARFAESRDVWALRDVSFELRQGDMLGVIGHNGAGKSTLLKVLSHIVEPTTGIARIRGRVGALIEVGTGFHPELTGRENVFLNGAILGMTRADIRQRFDDIVTFSGVDRYLDTPVKFYSSGMQMRLAFSVAAHLEPEVLLTDEVLAVGDADFQKRCLGKMSSIAGEGRTVVFVSHNLTAVRQLCQRALLIESGRVAFDGSAHEAVALHLGASNERLQETTDLRSAPGRAPGMAPLLRRIVLRDGSGELVTSVGCGEQLLISLDYESDTDLNTPEFAVHFRTSDGLPACHITAAEAGVVPVHASARGRATCLIRAVDLAPGVYVLDVGCRANGKQLDLVEAAAHIEITPSNFYGTGRLPARRNGVWLARAGWTTEPES